MTANVKQIASAGIYKVYWAKNSSGGVAYGTTGSISAGADAGMGILDGIQNYGATLQQPQRVNIEGDDGAIAQFIFQPTELPSGDLQVGTMDLTLAALAQGTSVFAETDISLIALNPGTITLADISLVINQNAKSRASGSVGEAGYVVTVVPKANLLCLGASGIGTGAGTTYTFAVTLNKSSVTPWGLALASGNLGTTEAAVLMTWAENPMSIHTYVADGSTTTFSTDLTAANAGDDKMHVYKDGVLKAYTTDYTYSGTTVTLAAAGTTGQVWSIFYEYTP